MKIKNLLIASIAAFAVTATTGCEFIDDLLDKDDEQVTRTTGALSGMYVSGHLGSYDSCPEMGYSVDPVEAEMDQAAAPPAEACVEPEGDDRAGDVAPGGCGGGGFLNCEGATVTISVFNIGRSALVGVDIERIDLLDEDGNKLAELPVDSLWDIDDNQAYDGLLGLGESAAIRIDYQGPSNVYQLLQRTGGARYDGTDKFYLDITLSAEGASDVTVRSKGIDALPLIAT